MIDGILNWKQLWGVQPKLWKIFQPLLTTHLWVQVILVVLKVPEQEAYEQCSVSQVQLWRTSLSPRFYCFKKNSKSKTKLSQGCSEKPCLFFLATSDMRHCSCGEESFHSGRHIASIAQLDRKWKDFRWHFDWRRHRVVMHQSKKGKRRRARQIACPIPLFPHSSFCLDLSSFLIQLRDLLQ